MRLALDFCTLHPKQEVCKRVYEKEHYRDENIIVKGLFRGAIAESGSILTDWAIDRDQITTGYTIAKYANCPLEPYDVLLQCLRTINPKELNEAQHRYSVKYFTLRKIHK